MGMPPIRLICPSVNHHTLHRFTLFSYCQRIIPLTPPLQQPSPLPFPPLPPSPTPLLPSPPYPPTLECGGDNRVPRACRDPAPLKSPRSLLTSGTITVVAITDPCHPLSLPVTSLTPFTSCPSPSLPSCQIVEVLTESLTLLETPIPLKIARFMLVSDILHNSSAPVRNASAYRTAFQQQLPDIMESFNDVLCGITGRITAQTLKV